MQKDGDYVARNKNKTKEERIRAEKNRLNRIYKDLNGNKKAVAAGLIERAAHMRVTLEDFAEDLDQNGYVERFSQGDQEPYERKRPTADLYNTMNTSYQKAIKQLTDLLPKEEPVKQDDDDFDNFVCEREEV